MIQYGLDTNVILRTLISDDPQQADAARQFGAGFGKHYTGYITLISLLEIDWALRSHYGFAKKDVATAIGTLIRLRGVTVESHDLVVRALMQTEDANADFADALITARSLEAGCASIKTFDKKAASCVPGMELLA
jgi:predicted nucleic-acid-binding protein